MIKSTRFTLLLAAAGLAASGFATAQNAQTAPTAAAGSPQSTVTVKGEAPKDRRVAPAWDEGRNYKFREIVNYDGWVFQAESGSAHRRPNINADDGWVKLNACDDLSEGSILCEVANQAKTTDAQSDAQKEYNRVKQDMMKGKPTSTPES